MFPVAPLALRSVTASLSSGPKLLGVTILPLVVVAYRQMTLALITEADGANSKRGLARAMLKDTNSPDILIAKTSPTGCVGPLLLAIGITVLALIVPARIPWFIGIPAGVGLIFGGLYHRRVIIDRANKRIEIQGYCVCPIASSVHPIDASGHVDLRRDLRRMGGRSHRPGFHVEMGAGSQTVYPLLVVCGHDAISIGTLISEAEAQRDAKRLARFLELPLHDSSSGTLQVRQPQLLYESLAQRARRLGLRTALPELDVKLRAHVGRSRDKVQIIVPPQGWVVGTVLGGLSAIVFGVLCLRFLWTPPLFIDSPDVGQWILGILGTLFLGILPLVLGMVVPVADARRQVTLEASKELLRITTTWMWWRRSITIPANEIEDVELSGPSATRNRIAGFREQMVHQRQIVIRTAERSIKFGRHLSGTEQDYLRSLIRAVLEE